MGQAHGNLGLTQEEPEGRLIDGQARDQLLYGHLIPQQAVLGQLARTKPSPPHLAQDAILAVKEGVA
mgnify:FL=1